MDALGERAILRAGAQEGLKKIGVVGGCSCCRCCEESASGTSTTYPPFPVVTNTTTTAKPPITDARKRGPVDEVRLAERVARVARRAPVEHVVQLAQQPRRHGAGHEDVAELRPGGAMLAVHAAGRAGRDLATEP